MMMIGAAPPAITAPQDVRRDVVMLYFPRSHLAPFGESPYTATISVLHHLGLRHQYHDISQGVPAIDPASIRGAVCFAGAGQLPDPEGMIAWLGKVQAAGGHVVFASGVACLAEGPQGREVPRERWTPLLEHLGVDYRGDFVADQTKVEFEAPRTFEAPYTERPRGWTRVTAKPGEAEAIVRVRRVDSGEVSDAVVAGPHGALAMDVDDLIETNPLTFRLRWHVDPFALYRTAFGLGGVPALDPTTISGRRAFFAHIDGDGFRNKTFSPRHLGRPAPKGRPWYAAEVVRDHVLAATALPTTVSVIANEMAGNALLSGIARSIFAMPNVEAASHSYNHPHDWFLGLMTTPGEILDGMDAAEAEKKGVKRQIVGRREIDDSFKLIGGLAPRGKRPEIMLWSGMTNPTPEIAARVDALGLVSMNGGDARLAEGSPSVANLAAYYRKLGDHIQVFTGAANENLFSNLWTGPFDGQRRALDLFRFAESPRRLAPVNIYYHFYAAERVGGLKALRELYGWAAAEPLAPVFASTYAKIVKGYVGGRLTMVDANTWAIAGTGDCRTLRFDAEGRRPDMLASRGVAGYNMANGSLYVHLAGPDATVVLAERPAPVPHLMEANAPVIRFDRRPDALEVGLDATVPAQIVLAGYAPGQAVTVRGRWLSNKLVDGRPSGPRPAPRWDGVRAADAEGRLAFKGPAGPVALEVRP